MLGFEDLSDEEDEDGALVCRVCREGYKSRPRELLGVYCFCKRVEGAAAAGGGGGTPSSTFAGASSAGYSSVSHFNAIHFSCHAAARRADIALRPPKREWEGAALRNSETRTNNLLPVAGLESGAEAYARAVESWWENLAAAGRPEPPSARLRLALGDAAMLLGRFAVGASFSADCHGGGRESNASAIPALLRLAAHELHTAREEENLGGGEGGTNNNLFDGVSARVGGVGVHESARARRRVKRGVFRIPRRAHPLAPDDAAGRVGTGQTVRASRRGDARRARGHERRRRRGARGHERRDGDGRADGDGRLRRRQTHAGVRGAGEYAQRSVVEGRWWWRRRGEGMVVEEGEVKEAKEEEEAATSKEEASSASSASSPRRKIRFRPRLRRPRSRRRRGCANDYRIYRRCSRRGRRC